jgi:hypothetical protein
MVDPSALSNRSVAIEIVTIELVDELIFRCCGTKVREFSDEGRITPITARSQVRRTGF